METRKFLNQSQPQTLQGAIFLLYFGAVFGLIGVRPLAVFIGVLPTILIGIGGGVAAYFMANDKKAGYYGALAVAALRLGGTVLFLALYNQGLGLLVTLAFDGLLVYLLVHPMSKDYARLWFR